MKFYMLVVALYNPASRQSSCVGTLFHVSFVIRLSETAKTNSVQTDDFEVCSNVTYLDTAIAVIAAGSLLSFLSNAVCIVNLLRNTSCFCHRNPN